MFIGWRVSCVNSPGNPRRMGFFIKAGDCVLGIFVVLDSKLVAVHTIMVLDPMIRFDRLSQSTCDRI